MKILIVSDTHGKHENLIQAVRLQRPFDKMIHLGDAEGEENYIQELADCPLEIVAGNNDFFSALPKEKELILGKYRVLITHGHYYYVAMGIENIKREARARRFDIVMFGHTHRPVIDYGNQIIAVNPGSISYPRQDGRNPSYMIMELDEKGEAKFRIFYL